MRVLTTVFLGMMAVAGSGAGFVACGVDRDAGDISQADAAYSDYRIMPADRIAKFTKNIPGARFALLDQVLKSDRTLWYDDESVIPSYQDSVGDGRGLPIGARANATGQTLDIARHLFSGKDFKFPFGHTAGADRATNMEVANFLHLPERDGVRLPVVYWVERNRRRGLEQFGDVKWKWMYPRGTIVGEVIYVRDPAGELHASEIRTRTRFLSGWATNVYRPYASAVELAAAIRELRPNWSSDAGLSAVVNQLERGSLEARSLRGQEFRGVFDREGAVDVIPEIADAELVRALLRRPFVSVFGSKWKESGGRTAFAGSAKGGFSVFPVNYDAGVIAVDQATCASCHADAGRAIRDFDSNAVLYGDVWGEDGIFSFHPWDHTAFREFNNENRRARPEFERAGIIAVYDRSVHTAADYAEIR